MTEEHEESNIHAAIYARVSTDEQAEGYSLEGQVEACLAYAVVNGMVVHSAHIFRDDMSGAKRLEDRPVLMAVRELARTKRIQVVIIWKLDRLARVAWHLGSLMDEWKESGVILRTSGERFDDTPDGETMRGFMGVVAQVERRKIIERSAMGTKKLLEAGFPAGGVAPYGYRWSKKPHASRYVVDDTEAAVVRRVFQRVLQGQTTRHIAKLLTMEGIPSRMDGYENGKKHAVKGHWTPGGVSRMLRYQGYTGTAHHNKKVTVFGKMVKIRPEEEWIPISMPVIIDQDTFNAVAVQLSHNKHYSSRNRKHDYLFWGQTLKCGRCGKSMHARPGHTLKRYYYVCSTQNRRLDGSECKKSLSGRMVERSVWAYIERLVSEPQQIIDAITMARQGESNPRQEVERRIKALDTRLSAMERAKQKDLEAFEEDFIDRATLRELGKKYDMEKDEIAKQHMILEVELAQLGAPPPEMEALSLFLEGIKARIPGATIAQKKDVLRALKVVVYWVPQQPLRMDLTIPSRTAGLGCTVNMEIPPEVPGGPPQQPGETIQAYIQRLYADGRLSTVGLARRLNAERVPTPQSHRHQSQWSRYMVDYYMRDKRYAWK